ncbi:SLC25A30 [Symbiodinium necroappetens]|uniref:SLC25A30 protein n=1 Tax=Symbiodinium necroappetens TaxID=1628268 RepID=A0A812KN55_9DINO|nr:SLC25A30 [Symbiodinium microadriaticum]CAE7232826.1 SLC25A30 [Symbiodinium necroappetens]
MDSGSAALVRLVASAIGAGVAEAATLPADVAKVRLQLQSSSDGELRYHGMMDCIVKVAKVEGLGALWKGLVPALVRQVSYHSFTFVLYEPIRDVASALLAMEPGQTTYLLRLVSAGTSAAIAIALFNPTEVIKTQIQSSSASLTMREVASKVWKKDGAKGFWAGVRPNVVRTFLVNGAEIGTYDESKLVLIESAGDGLFAHVGASFVAGLASACVSTPADVVKTRFMNAAGSDQAYRGIVHTLCSILRLEGFLALYKGFALIVCRKLIWCTVFFVIYERLLQAVFQALRVMETY